MKICKWLLFGMFALMSIMSILDIQRVDFESFAMSFIGAIIFYILTGLASYAEKNNS